MIVKAILILMLIILILGIVVFILIQKIKSQSKNIDNLYRETARLQNQLDQITLEQKIKSKVENEANAKKNKIRSNGNGSDNFAASLDVLRNN